MDIIIKDLSGKAKIAATSEKGRILGVSSGPYSSNMKVYLNTEAMENFRKPLMKCEDLYLAIGENYIEFYPERGRYTVQINS